MRTHLDLFSGIGGFALACRWAGVQTVGFAEIDEYACKVLAKNFPGVTNYGDVRNVPGRDDAIWLITGGFPCQPFSVAGKQRGADDDRWLWPEMAGVIERVRPTWVLAENVPGIVGMELDTVLSDLEGIGYTAWPIIVPAVGVDAPHRRERVWIVGNAERRGQSGHDGRRAGQEPTNGRAHVAYANGGRLQQCDTAKRAVSIADTFSDVSNTNGAGLAQRQGIAGDDGTQQPAIVGACRWAVEPGVGRVANGIPRKLDGGRLDEQGSSEKSGAEGSRNDFVCPLWKYKETSTTSPRHQQTNGCDCALSTVPYEYPQGAGNMGQREKGGCCLRDMQSEIYSARFTPTQNMQQGMPQQTWSNQRPQAMEWQPEPNTPRIATGVKNRVDRLRGLGNAIVPQVAYQLIRMMIATEAAT